MTIRSSWREQYPANRLDVDGGPFPVAVTNNLGDGPYVEMLAGSMAGIPPLAGFLSKELILKKAMLADFWVHALAISAIVLGSIGTVAYSSRFFFEIFSGS